MGINAYVCFSTSDRIVSAETAEEKSADCILILGCLVRADNEPSLILRDRLDTGIALYNAGAAPKIIMSGDHGRVSYDEVNTMKAYAIERGVPSEDIFMDHAGFSTYESMYRARDIFCAEDIIVVSQKFHLNRALYIADGLGLRARGVASDINGYGGKAELFNEIRESAARCKEFFNMMIKPQPTYLGETIPVWGDGNATNDKEL